MKYIALLIALILVIPVAGQRKKKEDEEVVQPVYVEGIPYSLPRTGIRLYVKAVKEAFEPGPYAGYAEQLLGIRDAKSAPATNWSLIIVRMETFSEPDPEHVYKAMGETASLVTLSSDGCLVGINAGTANLQPKQIKANKVTMDAIPADSFSFDYFTDTPFYIPGDSTNNFRPVRVTTEQKATEAAQRILLCRSTQYEIAANMLDEFTIDGEAVKAGMEKLKQIEKDYLSLFVGRTTSVEDIFSFDFIPKPESSGKGEVIFRISDEKGVVPASDLLGKPVMLEYEIEKSLTDKLASAAESENPAAGESGLFYRIPGVANFKVLYELNTISTARITVAQFGVVAPIPEDLIYSGSMIKLHPETGAISSVSRR